MRQALVNANPDLAGANSKYVMRFTGDNEEGKLQLDNFTLTLHKFRVLTVQAA